MELSGLSLGELQKLQTRIEKEIAGRNKKQHGQALDEMKAIAVKYGLKLEDIIARPAAPKGAATKAVQPVKAAKSAKKLSTIRFRHPDNPALTWAGSRGRRPQWIKDWEASGRSLDETRIKD